MWSMWWELGRVEDHPSICLRSVMTCTVHQVLYGRRASRTCVMHVEEDICRQGFGGKMKREKTTWKTQA